MNKSILLTDNIYIDTREILGATKKPTPRIYLKNGRELEVGLKSVEDTFDYFKKKFSQS